MDPKGEWRERESGLMIPAGSVADGIQRRMPVRQRRSATAEWVMARATQLTAIVAALALGVSIFTAIRQESTQRADANARRAAAERTNASRVHAWQSDSGVIVQNASPVALNWVILEWRRVLQFPPSDFVFVVVPFTLEPCTRWVIDNSWPKIKDLKKDFALDGVSFADANGAWKVDAQLGFITGPAYDPPDLLMMDILPWDPQHMRADPIQGCSISS